MGIWVLIFEVHYVVSMVQVYLFLLIMLPNVIAFDLFYSNSSLDAYSG